MLLRFRKADDRLRRVALAGAAAFRFLSSIHISGPIERKTIAAMATTIARWSIVQD
jgi:hypothetical protein